MIYYLSDKIEEISYDWRDLFYSGVNQGKAKNRRNHGAFGKTKNKRK